VLAFIEERDISKCPGAYGRLKDLVTSPTLWVRRMQTDAYPIANHLHLVQCANERSACPISFGDTRIVALHVDLPAHEIPKPILMQKLREQAPAFLHALYAAELPKPIGRLRLPVIETTAKQQIVDDSVPDLARAIIELAVDEWSGTASDLEEATGLRLGTMRAVRGRIREVESYLASHSVKVTFGARTNRGAVVSVSRTTEAAVI
jgi:hypothetical protein